MGRLPKEVKLTRHARIRLDERKDPNDNNYNTRNLMKSSCKWYTSNDFIQDSSMYIHSLYVCRKSKQKFGYLTDGKIEVLYDKSAKVAITILEVKEKFQPITQYIKPEVLEQIKRKKNNKLKYSQNIENNSTINSEVIIDNYEKNMDNIEETTMTFEELYALLIEEILNCTSKLKHNSIEPTIKTEKTYNIIYKEKPTKKPITASELLGIDKMVNNETITAVEKVI